MFALVHKGKVVQIESETFDVHADLQWVECDESVSVGDSCDGDVFSSPDDNAPYNVLRKSAYLLEWPVEKQLEAHMEAAMGDTAKLDAFKAYAASVKQQYPKE